MNRRNDVRRRWPLALPPLLTIALAGCQFSFFGLGGNSEEEAALLERQFQNQLALSTRAINEANLAGAREHLEAARAKAATPHDLHKVESLAKLIDGAEAMLAGDTAKARTEWSAIGDQTLRREVKRKAKLIGMSIPAPPEQSGGAQ
jgi:hypothetical protein